MHPLFDIAADLDTPVSAFMKLTSFRPRFLLESVEHGTTLGRYSFIGFGDGLEARLTPEGLLVNGELKPRPESREALLDELRALLELSPELHPALDELPFRGGLVGVLGYDIVRYFERLPEDTDKQTDLPEAAFVAPSSMLVFDHLSRRAALLHSGSEATRQALRNNVVAALRGAVVDKQLENANFLRPTRACRRKSSKKKCFGLRSKLRLEKCFSWCYRSVFPVPQA